MDLIAKRKVGQSWHSTLLARAAASRQADALIGQFEAFLGAGMPEAEAAYRALAAFDLLWPMTEPTEAAADAAIDQAATDAVSGTDAVTASSGAAAASRID